jgi:ADP-ribosylation factor protein 1
MTKVKKIFGYDFNIVGVVLLDFFSFSYFTCNHFQLDTRTIFNVTKSSKGVEMLPAIDFDVEIISVEDINLEVMNDGGRSAVRAAVQKFYYRDTYGLVFVVDSTDRERIDEAHDTLHQLLNEEQLRNKPILIFANKQNLSNSMSFDELRDKVNLTKLDGNTKWHL